MVDIIEYSNTFKTINYATTIIAKVYRNVF